MLGFSLFWFGTTIVLLIVVVVLVFKLEDAKREIIAQDSVITHIAKDNAKLIREVHFYKNMKATEEINNGNNED